MIFDIHKAANRARVTIEPGDSRARCRDMMRSFLRLMKHARSPDDERGTPRARCSARIKLYIAVRIQMFNCLPPELVLPRAGVA